MKKIISIICLGFLLAHPPLQAQEESTAPNSADIIVLLLAHTALHFGLAMAHELGHALTAQLFVKCGFPIVHDPTGQPTPNIPPALEKPNDNPGYAPNSPETSIKVASAVSLFGSCPEFQSDLLNAIVHLAGPIAGLASSYLALTTTNIIVELSKKKKPLKAIKKGLQKPLFNEEQPTGIRGLVFTHMLLNTFTLFPFQTPNGAIWSDGEKIRQCFFKNKQ